MKVVNLRKMRCDVITTDKFLWSNAKMWDFFLQQVKVIDHKNGHLPFNKQKESPKGVLSKNVQETANQGIFFQSTCRIKGLKKWTPWQMVSCKLWDSMEHLPGKCFWKLIVGTYALLNFQNTYLFKCFRISVSAGSMMLVLSRRFRPFNIFEIWKT